MTIDQSVLDLRREIEENHAAITCLLEAQEGMHGKFVPGRGVRYWSGRITAAYDRLRTIVDRPRPERAPPQQDTRPDLANLDYLQPEQTDDFDMTLEAWRYVAQHMPRDAVMALPPTLDGQQFVVAGSDVRYPSWEHAAAAWYAAYAAGFVGLVAVFPADVVSRMQQFAKQSGARWSIGSSVSLKGETAILEVENWQKSAGKPAEYKLVGRVEWVKEEDLIDPWNP